MGRWRPPQPRSSKYITAEGYARLNEELKYLWKVKRPEITQSVKEARSLLIKTIGRYGRGRSRT
jgi:transcription elongation factor GreB